METRHPVCAVLLLIVLQAPHGIAQTLWNSPHGPGMRGLSPATVAAQPALKWKLELPQGIGHGGVTFSDGGKFLYFKTYGLAQGRVYKVEAATGRVVWISPVQFGRMNLSGVTVVGTAGRLYTAGNRSSEPGKEAFVACLDIATGKVLWRTPVSHPPVKVGAGDGNMLLSPDRSTLYLHDADGMVAALDAVHGAVRWVHPVPGSQYTIHETLGPAWQDPSTGRARLVVCANAIKDSILCLEDQGASASVAWKTGLAKGLNYRFWGHAASSPDDRSLYLNGFADAGNPVLTCLDRDTGQVEWSISNTPQTAYNIYPPSCVGADGTIYLAGYLDDHGGAGCMAVSPDGEIRWSLNTAGGELNGWPAVTASGVLYSVDQGKGGKPALVAVKDAGESGRLLWRVSLPANFGGQATPVPGPDGSVYIAPVALNVRPCYLYAFAPAGTRGVVPLPGANAPEPSLLPKVPIRIGVAPHLAQAPHLPVSKAPPVLVAQLGQAGPTTSVAFSPDGKYLATGGWDNTARLWEVATGIELRSFVGHSHGIMSVAFSLDARYLVTGSRDNTARLWEVGSGKEVRRFTGHTNFVNSVAFSPDGRCLATGSYDNTARLWDVSTGKVVRVFEGHTDRVYSVAFSPDGRYLATVSLDKTTVLWETATGRKVRRFTGQGSPPYAVDYIPDGKIAFSPDGKYLATGSQDNTAVLWEVATGKEVRRITETLQVIWCLAFSPDGRNLATGSEFGATRLWDVATGEEVLRYTLSSDVASPGYFYIPNICAVAFSPDGRYLATGCSDGCTHLWDTATGKELRKLAGHSASPNSVAFLDGGHLAVGASDNSVPFWDFASGKVERRLAGHSGPVTWIARSQKYLATVGADSTAVLWETATGTIVQRFMGSYGPLYTVAVSPDGRYIATGGLEKTAWLREAATGKELRQFTGHADAISSVAFSPDGRYLATGSFDKTARLWETETGKEVRRLEGHTYGLNSVAFSPDARYMATGSDDGTSRLWETDTGKTVRVFEHARWVGCVAFSSDGKYLATGSGDNIGRLWDVATGMEVAAFTGHTGGINSVSFSPDTRYLATGGMDGTTRLWEIGIGKELCQLISFRDDSWAVVDPFGRYDASNAGDIEGLHWVVGNEPIALSQLKDRYYEPGLLSKLLGYNKEPLRVVKDFKQVALPPLVTVFPPGKGSSTAIVKLIARDGGIGPVTLSVNGSEFVADARGPSLDPRAARATLSVDLQYAPTLKPGANNVITAVARTRTEPRIASRPAAVSWKAPGVAQTRHPRLFALVAGISDYAGDDMDLKYAGKDAVDVYTTLKMAASNLYGKEYVDIRLLTTAGYPQAIKPTKAALEKVLRDFRQSKTSDTVLLYLAGHGVTLKQGMDTYCYLTQDARSADGVILDPAVRKQASLTSNEMAECLKRIPALKKVVILDTCGAGSAGGVLTQKREIPGDQLRAIALLQGRVGTQILMGCAADAVSYEATRFGQGLLTYAILDGVRGAALQNDQFVDVGTLFRYVAETVPKLAGGVGGIQKPEVRSEGQPFAVGRMLPEDKAKVPVGFERPLVLRPVFQDQQTGDQLRLAARVRDRILEMEWAETRAVMTRGTGPGIGYVDADEMPGALRPRADYAVDGTEVRVHLVVWQDEAIRTTADLTGATDRLDNLVDQVVQSITTARTSEAGMASGEPAVPQHGTK